MGCVMTADIRTAAEDAMIRANAVEPLVVVKGEEAVMQLTDYGNGFIAGAAWAAARVTPTREQIEDVLTERTDQSDETGSTDEEWLTHATI